MVKKHYQMYHNTNYMKDVLVTTKASSTYPGSWDQTGRIKQDDAILSLLSIILKYHRDQKRSLMTGQSVPSQCLDKQCLMVDVSRIMKNRKIIWNCQYLKYNHCSSVTMLMNFYDKMIDSSDKRGVVDVIYLYFSNDFETISHSIHVAKSESYRQADYKVYRNLIILPDNQVKRGTSINSKSHWCSNSIGILQRLVL